MSKRVFLVLLACALFALPGCDTVKPYVKSSKRFYKDWINTDPTIDLQNPGISDPSVRKLANLFTPVDERMEFLVRSLSAQDLPPNEEWCQGLMEAFPWLSGVAVLTDSGSVALKLPSFSMKAVDFAPLMDLGSRYKERKMAAYVAASELGAEVMIAKPLYIDSEFKGVLVAHFDMGALTKLSPEPGQLMVLTPGSVLWGGDDTAAAETLAKLNWKNLLKSEVTGEYKIGGTSYLWQARFLAQERLVYAVAAAKPEPKQAKPEPQPTPKAETPAGANPTPATQE
ncbi:hypothetical protein NNJEOMEG_02431 [Fundidesulfovibrio magnetotacticus]|uniref:Lipoprotein n=1 Tax=Fundidesulfovibrio magnetotacticus TaxID=2730080 RepID=A0A6V8LS71_9BACT|nr:hypothetical protein [Fundidesulfovibrio magnetotacticus]GFK94584.1 hypothetical protein NNJEOMEG_02431 [Fundidesulfovibrio magnetotacticus]